MDREELLALVFDVIKEHAETEEIEFDFEQKESMRLFGGGAPLDSLGLVTLITEIEEALEDKYDRTFTLTSDSAMSRRTSPFSRVSYLVDFILESDENS